jgi:hypothetical protein
VTTEDAARMLAGVEPGERPRHELSREENVVTLAARALT